MVSVHISKLPMFARRFVFCFFAFLSVNSVDSLESTKTLVNLLSADNYVILAKSGISTVPTSAIVGNIAVSPIAATAMTGFGLSADPGGGFSTSSQLTGQAFAANYVGSSLLTTAVGAMEAAYTDSAGRVNPDAERLNLGGGALGGVFGGATAPLTPGVYTFTVDVTIADTIYFQGSGMDEDEGETDVFIIQMTGNLKQVANTRVILSNGAKANNIFWQVAGHVTVAADAHMEGTLLAKTRVLFETGSSLYGRILTQTACVLQMATITQSAGQ